LALNAITNGYEASHGNQALEQTARLKLAPRYLSQAYELDLLAVSGCVLLSMAAG